MLRRTDWTKEDGTEYCDFYIVSADDNIKLACPVESHDHSNDDLQDEIHHFESAMCCSNCLAVVAKKEDILTEQVAAMKEATFQYELEMLAASTRCYSATNEHQNRFDVARFKASATNITLTTDTSDKHSWFPGYRWSIASCSECDQHLGWGFHESTDSSATHFFGLVVTSLRESVIPEKPFMRHVARARKEDGNVRMLLKCTFAGAIEIRDRVMSALKRSG